MLKKNKVVIRVVVVFFLLSVTSACNTTMTNVEQQPEQISINVPENSIYETSLSYGAIKKYLKIGVTTQADILKLFGSPNNMTTSGSGNEIWVYDKVRTELSTTAEKGTAGGIIGGGIGIGSGGVGAAAGGSKSKSTTNLVSTTNTLTVIMEYNEKNILIDYSARQGRY